MTIHALLLTDGPLVQRVGRTLAHSVWQGLAIAAGLRLAMAFARSPAVGYALAVTALASLPLVAVVTFVAVGPPAITEAGPEITTRISPARAPLPALAAPASRSASSSSAIPSVMAAVVLLWTAGVTAQAAWHLGGWTRVRRLGLEPPTTDARWSAALAATARRLGVTRRVRLLASGRVDVPVVVGVLRPAIVLPLSLLTELPSEQVSALLAHELAHIRRHDYGVNLVQCGIEAVFFYHPGVWWMSAVVRREREHCCDDAAASATSRSSIAAALVALEQRRGPHLSMAVTGSPLADRIRRLIGTPRSGGHRSPRPAAGLVVIVVFAIGAGWTAWGPARAVTASTRATTSPSDEAERTATDHPDDCVLRELLVDHAAYVRLLRAAANGGIKDPDAELLEVRRTYLPQTEADIATRVAFDRGPRRVEVIVGPNGFMSVDGGVGSWSTVLQRLVATPVAERATASLIVMAESAQVPAEDLSRAESMAREAVAEAEVGRVEVNCRAGDWPAPSDGNVFLGGDVPQPGAYVLGGRRLTLKQLVVMAGGTTPDSHDWVSLYRYSPAGRRGVFAVLPYVNIKAGVAPDY